MTDTEVEALFAERVLGWEYSKPVWDHDGRHGQWLSPDGGLQRYGNNFHPLTSLDDAFAGLAAHPEWGLVSIERATYSETMWYVGIMESTVQSHHIGTAADPDEARAVILACLRAVGCDV